MKLLLCSTCSTAEYSVDRAAVVDALVTAGLSDAVEISEVECLGGCDQSASIGLQSKDRATYVFSGVNVCADSNDIAATCETYLNSKDGWIENALTCGRLRHLLRARIPAL